LIVAFVGAGIVFVSLLLAGVAALRFSRTEQGKQMVGAVSDAFKMATDGMNAQGTEALRKAGCKQAMVIDMRRAVNVGRAFAPKGAPGPGAPPSNSVMVTCIMGIFDAPLKCDPIAKIYVEALGGTTPEAFFAMVQKQGSRQFHCMGLYSKTGALLRAVPPPGQKAEGDGASAPPSDATPAPKPESSAAP
jgi:hypothetical protein